ncbi:uncharacterized protein LOC124533116 [Vanessa cardui]|uniref:uncharacterized protein LOC124533116 n=1 Tax=Vanessa cardui TaxID=171605 RepID=UPI001F13834C|nr:uncharacterized protein LOC124533116 [Vanessa cardui]
MYALFVLFLITTTEAKRALDDIPEIRSDYKVFNNYGNNEQSETVQQGFDFGHVYRNSFRDPSHRRFEPESEMPESKQGGKIKEIIKKSRQNKLNLNDHPQLFLSPRDEILHHKKNNISLDYKGETTLKTNRPLGIDFSNLLERNLANPLAHVRNKAFKEKYNKNLGTVKSKAIETNLRGNLSDYFQENTFFAKPKEETQWTTCTEFAKRAVFHPDDVVNTKWLPFYIWSTRTEKSPAIVHTFSYPTKKIVQFYKSTYSRYIRNINWKEPKLLLKESRDILLIAGDRRGLFYGIPKQELPSAVEGKNITLPLITLRMKIHDPYLAMLYCDENYALLMAELGTEPQSDQDKTLEASTLKFRGVGYTAYRDLEAEAMLERLEKLRKIEAESRKIIQIPIPSGDVDFQTKH